MAYRAESRLRLLIDTGAHDWACSATTGDNALHLAVEMRHPSDVTLLLNAGIDPNGADHARRTPLHDAALTGCHQIGRILLKRGADVNARTERGLTPLHFAAMDDSPPGLNFIQFLVYQGADVKATAEGQTARAVAYGNLSFEAAKLLRRLGG